MAAIRNVLSPISDTTWRKQRRKRKGERKVSSRGTEGAVARESCTTIRRREIAYDHYESLPESSPVRVVRNGVHA